MKVMKNQRKTWNSQQSDIDHFAKLQNCFLQKFLKHILTDTLDQSLISLAENLSKNKIHDRIAKSLSQNIFQIQKTISIDMLISTVRDYIKPKCPSFVGGQLQKIMELQYFNYPAEQRHELLDGELALVEVRIRVDIQKIEELPLLLEQRLSAVVKKAQAVCPVAQLLRNYRNENINFVIIYYGEYNFELVNKRYYMKQECSLLGRKYKLRIFTIFISKIGLLETFRTINKIEHAECINDLTIQVYEMKRQRARRKKQKKEAKAKKNEQDTKRNQYRNILQAYGVRAMIGIAVVGMSMMILKKMFT